MDVKACKNKDVQKRKTNNKIIQIHIDLTITERKQGSTNNRLIEKVKILTVPHKVVRRVIMAILTIGTLPIQDKQGKGEASRQRLGDKQSRRTIKKQDNKSRNDKRDSGILQ